MGFPTDHVAGPEDWDLCPEEAVAWGNAYTGWRRPWGSCGWASWRGTVWIADWERVVAAAAAVVGNSVGLAACGDCLAAAETSWDPSEAFDLQEA